MIGKITIGKSFRGCLLYCLNDKLGGQNQQEGMKERSEVLMYNRCYGNDKELIGQFNEVRQLNPNLSSPVLHITLSLAPGEKLGNDKLMEVAEDCARQMGFENNQFVAISHRDTNHQHLHIVANRIGFDKRTVSDSKNYEKIANYCRKMERKYGLKQVANPKRFLSKEQRNMPRSDQRKEQLRENINDALKKSSDFKEFERQMGAREYKITKGRGISFADEKKVKVKGSQVNYSLQTIEQILDKQRSLALNLVHVSGQAQMIRVNKHHLEAQSSQSLDDRNVQQQTLLEKLIKPDEKAQGLNHHLLEKKKRRKKQGQSRHL